MKQFKQTTLQPKTVEKRLQQLSELEQKKKDIELQINLIKDGLKINMDNNGLEALQGETLYCYYKSVVKNIADTDKMKKDDIYNQYSKTIEYKTFNYNVIK